MSIGDLSERINAMKNKPIVIAEPKIILSENKQEVTDNYFSHSRISMMLKCPAQYEFRYVKGLKIPPAGAFIMGNSYHKSVADGYSFKLANKEEPNLQLLEDSADTEWSRQMRTNGEIDWQGNPGSMKDDMISLVKLYHKTVMPKITPETVEVVEDIEIGGITFKRVRDLVTKDGIIDHKVSSKKYSDYQKTGDLQSLAYTYPTGGTFNYHVAVKNKGSKDIQIIDFSRTKEEVEWYATLVTKIVSQIKAGIFPPNPTQMFCSEKWCGYFHRCRKH